MSEITGPCDHDECCEDCCEDPDDNESPAYSLYGDPDGYDRNGAYDGFQVTSDAEGGL